MSQDARATIALLPGDGIGPEVVAEARRVLEAVGESAGVSFAFEEALIGGAAIDATGAPLPDETVALCKRADAVLLGAVGGPQWDDPAAPVRPEQGLLGIRRALGLFANLRPVAPHPALADASPLKPERLAGVDLVVVRELTGGIYFGVKGTYGYPGRERARDVCAYSTEEITRIVRVGAGLARARRGKLTSVDKANVLETSRLWRETVTRLAPEYDEVSLDHLYVDNAAMQLVSRPTDFDVIVTENLFGDILSDEAAMLTGSLGMLPSASMGEGGPGVYEPVHGSAPDIAGTGKANPLAMLLSVAMMLRYGLGMHDQAGRLETAVDAALGQGLRTPDLGGGEDTREVGTEEMTGAVLAAL
jgi:3-isopropylmalate dehydrogenase